MRVSSVVESNRGKYRDVIPLGRGGMGDVTLAVLQGPSGFNKLQVIKRLRIEIADNTEFVDMFLHEARLAARLSHPNIVQTNEVGQDEDVFFIAMEYLEGQTLHALLRQSRRKESSTDPAAPGGGGGSGHSASARPSEPTPLSGQLSPAIPTHTPQSERALPVAVGLRIVSDALEGLHYAHELTDSSGNPMELVHRDFSPGNVFITYDGNIKVLDFGIAKAADSEVYTRTGIIKGKVPYMAPEQFRSRNINRRCDLYAVGAVLWEIAAGIRLWHGLSDLEIITRLSSTGIPSPRTVNPMVHPRLEAICMRALSLNPNERYATAAEIQTDIDAVLREIGGATSRTVSKYITTLFAQKKAQQQAVIESKLRELRQAGSSISSLSMEMSSPWTVSRPSAGTSSGNVALNASTASGAIRFAHPVQTTSGVTTPNPPSSSQRSLGWLIALGSLAVIGLAVGGAYWVTRMNSPAPALGAAPSVPGTSAETGASLTPPPPPAPRTRLVVQASPADAQLYLDDAPLMINPYSGEVPQDGQVHRIRGEAKGFVSQTQSVTLSGPSAVVNLRLERGTRRRDPGK